MTVSLYNRNITTHNKIQTFSLNGKAVEIVPRSLSLFKRMGNSVSRRIWTQRWVPIRLDNKHYWAKVADLEKATGRYDVQIVQCKTSVDTAKLINRALESKLPYLSGNTFSSKRKVGEGGFKTVFKVVHETYQTVALVEKLFNPNPQDLSLFEENQIISLFDSSKDYIVAKAYEVFQDKLLMPFYEGNITEVRPKNPYLACMQITIAVAAVHAKGFMHRDIKPENILLKHGDAYLGDFGLAIATDHPLAASQKAGTPQYFAPEMVKGGQQDQRSDVWALTATLYKIDTSYNLTHVVEIQKNVEMGSFFPLFQPLVDLGQSSLNGQIEKVANKTMRSVLTSGLQINPKKRSTAAELRDALKRGEDS